MAQSIITSVETFQVEHCCNCGMAFAMTQDFQDRRRSDREGFFCPAGHRQYYVGKSDKQKIAELEQRVKGAYEYSDTLQKDIDHKVNQIRAHKGARTKLKKRIAAGVCPCCNRTFVNLGKHMKGQHPSYTEEKDDAGK